MSSPSPDPEVLVSVENVSKKFCRSLKKSLWYGVSDVASALNPFGGSPTEFKIQNSNSSSSFAPPLPPLRPDEFWAVQSVSFQLRRGECLGLIGHNGAGKSTLLKVLNGLIPPDTGRITMKGRVCALIELNAGFNPILSGRENIFNQAALLGFSREETLKKFDAIVEFSEIGDFLEMPVQNYSSGMRVRLGFAVAAQMEPDVLIIDEVLAVGDVAFRFKCLNAIAEIMKTAAVIFVSHTMPQVFRICSEVIVLDHGQLTYKGTNLAEGVGVYLSLFKGTEGNLSGSGEAEVVSVEMSGQGASAGMGETLNLAHGAEIQMKAHLKFAPGIRMARIQFLFWNAEMVPVMDVMDAHLKAYPFEVPDSGDVIVRSLIGSLNLNAGKYSMSVIVLSDDYQRTLCQYDNVSYVQVTAASTSGAHVLSVADWDHQSCVGNPLSV